MRVWSNKINWKCFFAYQLPTKNKSVGNLKFVYLKLIVLYILKINEKGDVDSYFKNGDIKNNLGK